ncbi:hypothetical protein FRB99_006573 [Tulasnella sp. 403]|nr:hypothetical protein FRB99_006573 [Tulasnella sp. 403]
MPQGKKVSNEVAWIVIRLSVANSPTEIAAYTDLHVSTINAILAEFRRTGGPRQTLPAPQDRRYHMTEADLLNMFGIINDAPDTYLDELQDELRELCGLEVSASTLCRALHRGGYTLKKR